MTEKNHDKKKKIGLNLYRLFRKTKGFDPNSREIPSIIAESIAWLREKKVLGEMGIFRISGPINEIKYLKSRYDKGKKLNLVNVTNVHTVAGLVKIFFRELPEPISTFELYTAFLEANADEGGLKMHFLRFIWVFDRKLTFKTSEFPDLKTRIVHLKKVIDALPPANKLILGHLFEFLDDVSQCTSNCMNVDNIAIVFAPNLIRSRIETVYSILTDSPYIKLTVKTMIEYYQGLFFGGNESQVMDWLSQYEAKKSRMSSSVADSIQEEKTNAGELPDKSIKTTETITKVDPSEAKIEKKLDSEGLTLLDKRFEATLKRGSIMLAKKLLIEQDMVLRMEKVDKMDQSEIERLQIEFVQQTSSIMNTKSKQYDLDNNRPLNLDFNVKGGDESGEKLLDVQLAESKECPKPLQSEIPMDPDWPLSDDCGRILSDSNFCLDCSNVEDLENVKEGTTIRRLDSSLGDLSPGSNDMLLRKIFDVENSEISLSNEDEIAADYEKDIAHISQSLAQCDLNEFYMYMDEMKNMKEADRRIAKKKLIKRIDSYAKKSL